MVSLIRNLDNSAFSPENQNAKQPEIFTPLDEDLNEAFVQHNTLDLPPPTQDAMVACMKCLFGIPEPKHVY